MTPAEKKLRTAERAFQRAEAVRETKRQERNAALLEALGDGMTHAKAAEITGLSRGRIGQIAPGRTDG